MSWEKVRLGKLVHIKTGKLDANASSKDGEYPFFTCSKEPLRISSYSFDCECVLVAGNGDLNVKYYNGKFDAYQRTYIIECVDTKTMYTRYLFHFLDNYLVKLREQSIGGVIKYIKLENLSEAEIPLPPLATQKRIAEILDAAGALRRKDQELLKKYDELAQAIFIDMFGDPVKNEKGWEVKKLREICFKIADIDHKMPKDDENGLPFISAKDLKDDGTISFEGVKKISKEDFDRLSKKIKPELNDIIYSRIGAKLGKARKVKTDISFIVSYSCCTIKPMESIINTDFLCYYLDSSFCLNEVLKKVRSIGVPDLGMDEVRDIVVPMPPLEMQIKFSSILESLDISKYKVSKEMNSNLFDSLIQKAFKGELVS